VGWKTNENAGIIRIFGRRSWQHSEFCSRSRLTDKGIKRILVSVLFLLRFDPGTGVGTHNYVFRGVGCFRRCLSTVLFTCNGVNEAVCATS